MFIETGLVGEGCGEMKPRLIKLTQYEHDVKPRLDSGSSGRLPGTYPTTPFLSYLAWALGTFTDDAWCHN